MVIIMELNGYGYYEGKYFGSHGNIFLSKKIKMMVWYDLSFSKLVFIFIYVVPIITPSLPIVLNIPMTIYLYSST